MATASTLSATAVSSEEFIDAATSTMTYDRNNIQPSRSPAASATAPTAPTASDSSPDTHTGTPQQIEIGKGSHADEYENFFKNIGAIATLGSSITFSLIVSKIQDPIDVSKKTGIDLSTVRILLAVTWLLFTVLLVVVFLVSGLVKERLKKFDDLNGRLRVMFSTIFLLIAAATICLSLVVAAYVEVLGWVGLSIFLPMAAFGQYWYLASAVLGDRFKVRETILRSLIGTEPKASSLGDG